MPTLGRNAPWSRCTVSLRSRRQRERPKSTGDSEENHQFIWRPGPSCVAKQSRERFKSKDEVHFTPTLEGNAPWSRRIVSLRSRRQRERPKSTGDFKEDGPKGMVGWHLELDYWVGNRGAERWVLWS